jgi:hypothetical protein
MRERYWSAAGAESMSPVEIPGHFAEWVGVGAGNLLSGDESADIIDRASLLYLLLHVEKVTPEYIPYLGARLTRCCLSISCPVF